MPSPPVVIAHRGASGYRPENTLAAFEYAVRLGAEWIETDVVSTRDGVLVLRHENEISSTTDVARRPEYADRRTTRHVDGVELTGWFIEDFTLDELASLRATERLPELRPASAGHDGRYPVPTLGEAFSFLHRTNAGRDRPVGLYVELKHPTYFAERGLSLTDRLLADLAKHDLLGENAPVWLESMETGAVRELAAAVDLPLTQLMQAGAHPYDLVAAGDPRSYADLCTPAELAEIATYAQRIGPSKGQVLPRDAHGRLLAPTRLVEDAHDAGLGVHVWTFRDENPFLPTDLRIGTTATHSGDATGEYLRFMDAGVDGMFTDFVDTARAACRQWVSRGASPGSASGPTR